MQDLPPKSDGSLLCGAVKNSLQELVKWLREILRSRVVHKSRILTKRPLPDHSRLLRDGQRRGAGAKKPVRPRLAGSGRCNNFARRQPGLAVWERHNLWSLFYEVDNKGNRLTIRSHVAGRRPAHWHYALIEWFANPTVRIYPSVMYFNRITFSYIRRQDQPCNVWIGRKPQVSIARRTNKAHFNGLA